MSKNLVHLYKSELPIRAGQNVIARCKDVVDRVEILCVWDELEVNKQFVVPGLHDKCPECWKPMSRKKGPKFYYAIKSRDDRASELVQERKYSDRADSNL